MKYIIYLLFVYLLARTLYGFFDGKEVVYSLMDSRLGLIYTYQGGNRELNSWDGESPPIYQSSKTTYKYADGFIRYVTDKDNSGVYSHKGCAAYDSHNWKCRYEDQYDGYDSSQTFTRIVSMKDGEYSEYNTGWTIEKVVKVDKLVDVSRLEYILAGCRLDFYSSTMNGLLVCPLRIFIQ